MAMQAIAVVLFSLASAGQGRRLQLASKLNPVSHPRGLSRGRHLTSQMLANNGKIGVRSIHHTKPVALSQINIGTKPAVVLGIQSEKVRPAVPPSRVAAPVMSLASLAPVPALGALFGICTLPLLPTLANNPTWVFSVGYGLSAAAAGIAILVSGAAVAGGVSTAAAAGLVIYGLRLAGFLYWRQNNWAEWNKRAMESPEAKAKNLLLPVLSCGAFYCLMCSPALWLLRCGEADTFTSVAVVGASVQWVGLILEAVSDYQKSTHKLAEPDTWCSSGVFSVIRHPNYLGEILHWIGLFMAGLPSMIAGGYGIEGVGGRLVPAILGLVGIVGLMLSVTPKLDSKQADKYGKEDSYEAYIASTKMLIPGVY